MGGPTVDQTPVRYPASGIDVVIVGGGPGGLLAALECWRKGHNVRIFESRATPDMSGDLIVIAPSAFSTLYHWPWMRKRVQEIQYSTGMDLRRQNGEHIAGPFPLPFETARGTAMLHGDHPPRLQWRPKLYGMLIEQVARIGLDIEWSKRASSYYETDDGSKGGVRFKDGTSVEGDVVLAADGVHSSSWRVTRPDDGADTSVNSGYSIYRTGFDSTEVLANPVVKQFIAEQGIKLPTFEFWYADDMHAHLVLAHDFVSWGVTHRNGGEITGGRDTAAESWSNTVPVEEALRTVSANGTRWHPAFEEIARATPTDGVVDFKLKFRSPNPRWHSDVARVLQIGDAAHTFIPTSGSGGTMAMEDAISIATCLQIAGKPNVPWAVRVHTKLRFDRVSCVQKMGFVNRDAMHQADWDEIARDPRRSKIRMGDWNWSHLPERYALDNYAACLDHLLVGSPFVNTNTPPNFKDGDQRWTVESLAAESKAGGIKVDPAWKYEELADGPRN